VRPGGNGPRVSLAGSAGVAIPGEARVRDWGLALGVSDGNFAARKVDGSTVGITRARHFVTGCLSLWDVPEAADDVARVAQELLTNAVRHTPAAVQGAWLGLGTSPRTILCVVRDPSRQTPAPRLPGRRAASGGLAVVAALSALWGWRIEENGKAVWARIPI